MISAPSAIGIATVVVIAAAGSASVLAEQTVPGDFLYPMKTTMNENIRGSLTFSAASEARFEAKCAIRRLEEAGVLASQLRLDTEVQTELMQDFSQHSGNMLVMAEQASTSEDGETALNALAAFRANLDTQEIVLLEIAGTHAAAQESLNAFIALIRTTKADVSQKTYIIHLRFLEGAGTTTSIETDAEVAIDAAAREMDAASAALRARSSLALEKRVLAEADIEEATVTLVRAREEYNRQAFAPAKALATLASNLAVQIRQRIEAEGGI